MDSNVESSRKNLRSKFFSSGGMLAVAFGAVLTLFVIWIFVNSTSWLYDVVSILIIAALAASLSAIASRMAIKSEVQHLGTMFTDGGTPDQALPKILFYLWEKRQTVFAFMTFVFLVSVFNGVVGISNMMINYLSLDNLKSQNSLLDAQNSMVEAQNDAILTDTINQTEERLGLASEKWRGFLELKGNRNAEAEEFYQGI